MNNDLKIQHERIMNRFTIEHQIYLDRLLAHSLKKHFGVRPKVVKTGFVTLREKTHPLYTEYKWDGNDY